ncbi:MAG: glycosyltransferase family 39 protein, partial [Gemmatimonadota bacterium]|nr:glycosyltransferase family 39 protein [Gemmatimonadota bacterium]
MAAFNPAPHNGGDNAAYVTLAFSLAEHGAYTDLYDPAEMPHTKYPPVFPGLLAVMLLLGARTWSALKTVSAVFTIAAVGFTYLWAERRLGAVSALGLSVMLAISPALVYYSHWILSDPIFLCFTMAALWALEGSEQEGASVWWLVGGVATVALAYFTRSAGLPLLFALFGWLALRRRWLSLTFSSIAIGVPALLWWIRGRGDGIGEYTSEFWMVDPYQPVLGTVSFGGLLSRAVNNLWAYVSIHGPGGVVGGSGTLVTAFGIGLTGLALVGWVRSVKTRTGLTEIFLPLYAGLILLWPEVWSGDRFALPLFPLFFLFAALALGGTVSKGGGLARHVIFVTVIGIVLLPAGRTWLTSVEQSSECRRIMNDHGPWGCYGSGVSEFAEAAAWMQSSLPEGSSVMTRKPRLFYLMSGLTSRTFPFDDNPGIQLAEADLVGARYVLLDNWDGLSSRYVGRA